MHTLGEIVADLLEEVYLAEYYESTWFKDNDPESSLLLTLDQVTHEQASRKPAVGCYTVAAHAAYVLFALDAEGHEERSGAASRALVALRLKLSVERK